MQLNIKKIWLAATATLSITLAIAGLLYFTPAGASPAPSGEIKIVSYSGSDEEVKLWIDCSRKSAIFWQFKIGADSGDIERSDRFSPDPDLDSNCQPLTNKSYGRPYHRGHIFGANFGDNDPHLIKQTNFWTNILPQHRSFNLSGFRYIEKTMECRREHEDVLVTGGVFPDEPAYDYIRSHQTPVPAHIWLTVQGATTGDSFSVIIPNGPSATQANMAKYVVPQTQIDERWGDRVPLPRQIDRERKGKLWSRTRCDQS